MSDCIRTSVNNVTDKEWVGRYVADTRDNPTLDYCKHRCLSDPQCQAWKLTVNPGPICYTTNVISGDVEEAGGVYSGVIKCKPQYNLINSSLILLVFICIIVFVILALKNCRFGKIN